MKRFVIMNILKGGWMIPFLILPLSLLAQEKTDPSVKDVHRLTNLPHVYINTFTGMAITNKTEYVYARMWYVDEDDQVTFYDSLQIRGRGNSTWNMLKKPYKLKFQQKEKLLGKGHAKTKKWTLLANHGDKTLIRNAITSLMGERVGLKFNPAAKFVDLTLNDSYVGNYQISDHIDVRPHRVNIMEQDLPLTDESDISGGYLLESDGFGDFHSSKYWDDNLQRYLVPDGLHTSHSIPVRIHYPDSEDLEQRQTDYIKNYLRMFEDRLFGADFTDEVLGYRPYVDSLSLANWYLCTEMSGNIDGFFSAYFYKEQADDHLFFGPLWDYDIAYNNDNRARGGTNRTTYQLMVKDGYGALRTWIQQMWKDPWFGTMINRHYQELIDDGMETYLNEKIDSLTLLINESQQLNYELWGIRSRSLRELVLYSTYDEYVKDVRNYIHNHFEYLKTAFAGLWVQSAPDPDNHTPDDLQNLDDDDCLPDYALAYDPQSGRLHFGSDNLDALTFMVRIYDHSGRLIRTFRACDGTQLSDLPHALYLITWIDSGRQRTVKLNLGKH